MEDSSRFLRRRFSSCKASKPLRPGIEEEPLLAQCFILLQELLAVRQGRRGPVEPGDGQARREVQGMRQARNGDPRGLQPPLWSAAIRAADAAAKITSLAPTERVSLNKVGKNRWAGRGRRATGAPSSQVEEAAPQGSRQTRYS